MVLADERRRLDELTEKVIGAAHEVSNTLGSGFLERVYENALAQELRDRNLGVAQQQQLQVRYKGTVVGDYQADLIVEGAVILELKAVKSLDEVHAAQCLNYLKATGLHVCLLLNFGKPRLEVRRVVIGF